MIYGASVLSHGRKYRFLIPLFATLPYGGNGTLNVNADAMTTNVVFLSIVIDGEGILEVIKKSSRTSLLKNDHGEKPMNNEYNNEFVKIIGDKGNRPLEEVLWQCFSYFFHKDNMNAASHDVSVKFSPITFLVAEQLDELDVYRFLDNNNEAMLRKVVAHKGMYPEDRGR